MSEQKINLALAFIQSHPKDAAATIELQKAEDAASFMGQIPSPLAALILSEMLPQYASLLCQTLPFEKAIAIMAEVNAKILANTLRLFPSEQRELYLKELPTKTQLTCTLILNYETEMVGAWITPNALTIPENSTVADALKRLETAKHPVFGNSVFIVDRDHKLKGKVTLHDLLRSNKDLPISAIHSPQVPALRGRLPISDAVCNTSWQDEDTMPVLNRRQEFIGILRHADLRRAVESFKTHTLTFEETPDLLTSIGQGYGQTLLVLIQSMQEFVQSGLRSNPKQQ